MSKTVRRRGFTLAEVLVTITIVAVLAAVVVPAVLNQVSKGDNAAVAQDLVAIRTGITTFTSDTRKFPGRLTDLGVSPLVATDKDIDNSDYGAAAVASYRGPYLNINGTHRNPAGALFRNKFALETNYLCLQDSIMTAGPGSITKTQAAQMDSLLDGKYDETVGLVKYTFVSGDSIDAGTFRACLVNK
jgi:prepilin-type N-terminal cleavage/methylation domain-containing protein